MKQEKIQAICDYLKRQFPAGTHQNRDDFDREGHKFKIETNNHFYLALFSREFIEENSKETIISTLDKVNIKDLFIKNNKSTIIFTGNGIVIEPRN